MLELLTPIAKSFPAERGFESNTLAVQVHGGYGYTSEYLPEAYLRDQKLNSIHEGTTGIQAQDLLGRKVLKGGGHTVAALRTEITRACERAEAAALDSELPDALASALRRLEAVTAALLARAAQDPRAALRHAVDYLDLVSTIVVAWQWLLMATAAHEGLAIGAQSDQDFYRGKLAAARYFSRAELPRVALLAALCESAEDSFESVTAAQL
jgi:butyryl-CoA dehydrogenase